MVDAGLVRRNLDQTLELVTQALTAEQHETIRTFIDVGESWLALETLFDVLYEHELAIPAQAYALILETARLVGLDTREWELLATQVVG